MELRQTQPFGTEGRKPTQDLLSLYSPVDQDPRPSQGGYMKTQDFLQPLERGEKNTAKHENTVGIKTTEMPPMTQAPLSSVEHILPRGIGTYSISHISYFNQRVPKPERQGMFTVAQGSSTDRNEETSNSSSFTGSGFTLWEESAMKKGKTGKENWAGERLSTLVKEPVVKLGQWSSERPSQSSSTHRNFSPSRSLGHNQSFIDIMRPAKVSPEEEEDDEEFILKKEISTHQGHLAVKVDGKISHQKANTPRSKHSATEQRRRSKINDRFQMLRELIPHSDQKRDKASFLLEVINYIQILQEKVHNYEGSNQGSDLEPPKVLSWKSSQIATQSHADQTQGGINDLSGPAPFFPPKIEENSICVSPTIPRNAASLVESDMGATTAFKGMDPQSGISNKSPPLPISLQPNIFPIVGSTGAAMEVPPPPSSDAENPSKPHSQLWRSRSCTSTSDCTLASNKLEEQGMAIKGGTISISSVYSQGLFNTLTHALQSSGVDLSQASISVHIELGKPKNGKLTIPSSTLKRNEIASTDRSLARSLARSKVSRCGGDSDQAQKRFKMQKS